MPAFPTQANGGALSQQTLNTINLMTNLTFPTQGNIWFVAPSTGSDVNNSGTKPSSPFKTLAMALSMATANQNDIVYLLAQNNTAASTTDYQNALLNWNKDMVHLIGVNAGPLYSQRSRVAFLSTYNAATDLFKLSANNCVIQGIEFFAGVAGTLPTGCMTVTGQRNRFTRCHIAGQGNTANDIAGAYSLNLAGAQECLFEDCTIGQDTVTLGANTAQVINFANASPANTRNWFRNCRIMLDTSSATACLFVRGGGAGNLDRETVFEDTLFLNAIGSASTTLTHAMAIATGGGTVIVTGPKTGLFGASGWNTNSGVVYATGGGQPSASTYGLATAQTS